MRSLFSAYHILRTMPKGLPRLLCILPLLALLLPLPFHIQIRYLRALLSFSFLWLGHTNLLLCWDISIDDIPPHHHTCFLISVILPLRIKALPSSSKISRFISVFLHLAGLVLVFNISVLYGQRMSIWLLHALHCAEVYLGLEVFFCTLSLLAYFVAGMETYSASDSPFMARSLSEFWGKRWNLLATNMLRGSVYEPVLRLLTVAANEEKDMGNKKKQSSKTGSYPSSEQDKQTGGEASNGLRKKRRAGVGLTCARCIAILATFAVSGLAHEVIFVCMTRSQATWEATFFFLLHGVATIVEKLFTMSSSFSLRQPVCNICTLAFLYFTVCWLFLAPLYRTNTHLLINEEFYQMQNSVVKLFSSLLY